MNGFHVRYALYVTVIPVVVIVILAITGCKSFPYPDSGMYQNAEYSHGHDRQS